MRISGPALTRTARETTFVALVLLAGSCRDSVTGPSGAIVFDNAEHLADSTFVGAAGSAADPRPSLTLVDGSGKPVGGAILVWRVIGGGGRVDHQSLFTNANGVASADWYLGTRVSEPQALTVEARKGGARAVLVLRGAARPLAPETVRLVADTTTIDLGSATAPMVVATDLYGNQFEPAGIVYRVIAGTAVTLRADGRLLGVARGSAVVESRVGSLTDTAVVRVVQRVGTIGTAGTASLHAIGATTVVRTSLTDVNGIAVADSSATAATSDTTIARVVARGDSVFITSTGVGSASVTLRAGDVVRSLPANVTQVVAGVRHDPESIVFASLGDTASIRATVLDSAATEIVTAQPTLSARDPAIVGVDPRGVVRALANGVTQLIISVNGVARDSIPVTVRQVPSEITVARDSFNIGALGAAVRLRARARDAGGNVIPDVSVAVQIEDSTIVVASGTTIVARANGATRLFLTAGTVQHQVVVVVSQRVARVIPGTAAIELAALGARAVVTARVVDSLGNVMSDGVAISAADSSVVRVVAADSVEAVATGSTTLTLSSSDRSVAIPVTVWQRPARIIVDETRFNQPLAVTSGSRIGGGAVVVDANGYSIAGAPLTVATSDGAVATIAARDTLAVVGSGVTTVEFRSGTLQETRTLRVYLPPVLAERRIAMTIDADTALGNPWAPTLTMAPDGQVRLYFAAYKYDAAVNYDRADLAFLTSTDTANFHYAGAAIQHQAAMSDPFGWGIENVVVTARADGPGMRMYFSGGSMADGWQVFSAVGDGVGAWSVEPGLRVSNGPLHLYPQGEGMVVLPDPAGGLRMIIGSMQLASGQANSWSIVEFHSPDGVQWDYAREVLRPGVPGSGTERSVYSPTIVGFGKGVWRMFYTGDNLGRVPGGGTSEMWSAVSFDRKTWIVEGVIIPAVDGNLYYASALGDKVAYVRTPSSGAANSIEIARMIQR